jgi:hypothetical protein
MADSTTPFRMTRPVALRTIRRLAAEGATLRFTVHARDQMRRRQITPRQVLGVLLKGGIEEGPSRDSHGCWRCTMRRYAAGETAVVVAAICGDRLVIVTAFDA